MSAFDTLAPTYDADFTQQPLGQILRSRVHDRLLSHFSAGDIVLEIGCGTGEDALFLAERGIHVTATDASEQMLSVAREKTKHQPNVTVAPLDLSNLSQADTIDGVPTKLHGVFSNFGALNCIDDWRPLAEHLSVMVKSGGTACFGIMSPYCAWEFWWHVGHFKWDIALRRLRGDDFEELRITYPTVKRITDDFAPYFKRINVFPLGLFLPTSALFDVVQKRPRLMQTLVLLEERFQNTSQLAMFADHYWIEFERI
ncbi:MAG: methyltransferase domain-containing protein [Chloroflexota bacterium]